MSSFFPRGLYRVGSLFTIGLYNHVVFFTQVVFKTFGLWRQVILNIQSFYTIGLVSQINTNNNSSPTLTFWYPQTFANLLSLCNLSHTLVLRTEENVKTNKSKKSFVQNIVFHILQKHLEVPTAVWLWHSFPPFRPVQRHVVLFQYIVYCLPEKWNILVDEDNMPVWVTLSGNKRNLFNYVTKFYYDVQKSSREKRTLQKTMKCNEIICLSI